MNILISFILTLLVFSYLLGDNILYRLTLSIFVGLAAAFTAVVTFQSVLLPLTNSGGVNALLFVIGGIFALLLLINNLQPDTQGKIRIIRILVGLFQPLRWLSKFTMALLIAIGTAAAVVGAVSGTIIPIASDTAKINFNGDFGSLLNSIILFVGVICSLLYFRYSAKPSEDNNTGERGQFMAFVATIGQGFIVIALGALYGAAILTSLTILSGQLELFLR